LSKRLIGQYWPTAPMHSLATPVRVRAIYGAYVRNGDFSVGAGIRGGANVLHLEERSAAAGGFSIATLPAFVFCVRFYRPYYIAPMKSASLWSRPPALINTKPPSVSSAFCSSSPLSLYCRLAACSSRFLFLSSLKQIHQILYDMNIDYIPVGLEMASLLLTAVFVKSACLPTRRC